MREIQSKYREELLERNLNPLNFEQKIEANLTKTLVNHSCGDELVVSFEIRDGKILEGSFSGVGCAISKVSADMMIDAIRGKTLEEARELMQGFFDLVMGIQSEKAQKIGGELEVFSMIQNMPARVKCAKLAWRILEEGEEG